ncbi:MAG TPA: hypothetical protein VFG50_12345 [Rhodothermales bacterium]|nr:hypothetical protein [Rhodothermales bacterium]
MPPTDFTSDQSYLASYTLPPLRFEAQEDLDLILEPLWHALHAREYARADAYGQFAMQDVPHLEQSVRAGLFAGVSAAQVRMGRAATAERLAERSLEEHPKQWIAHRILLELMIQRRNYAEAIEYLMRLPDVKTAATWDEALATYDRGTAPAAWAWRLAAWERVKELLNGAYPGGLSTMPEPLLEDYFRLALYRNEPGDAAAAATLLMQKRSVESTDTLLQTLVQQGWTEAALPLYRHAFTEMPRSALLRRRLVALCLKEGAIEEARRLASPAPLPVSIPHAKKRQGQINPN